LDLTLLAPDIQESLLCASADDESAPRERHLRHLHRLPWSEQRAYSRPTRTMASGAPLPKQRHGQGRLPRAGNV
jgi:hypothetical protein